MSEPKYRHEDCERLTNSFYLEVENNTTVNEALKSTVLGIIETAAKLLKEKDYKLWQTFMWLGESVWHKR